MLEMEESEITHKKQEGATTLIELTIKPAEVCLLLKMLLADNVVKFLACQSQPEDCRAAIF